MFKKSMLSKIEKVKKSAHAPTTNYFKPTTYSLVKMEYYNHKQVLHNRIRFLKTPHSVYLLNFLSDCLFISKSQIELLLELGAIYVNQRRAEQNELLNKYDIVRIHLKPKRYPHIADITENIIYEHDEFFIIDKPHGLPSQPTLDNKKENLLTLIEAQTSQKCFITHRLDVGTRGLICIAKNLSFQKWFNSALMNHQIHKTYQALCSGEILPQQLLTHWMRPHLRSPKILSRKEIQNWKLCKLRILEATKIKQNNQYEIQLLTGRTHQIRAQLSFEGNPIIGDNLYGGKNSEDFHSYSLDKRESILIEKFELNSKKLSFRLRNDQYHFSLKDA